IRVRLPQSYLNPVQTRVWVFRLKAQQITAVEVVGKANHVCLKALSGSEQLILATRHGGERFRGILSHRLSRGGKFLNDIQAWSPLVPVAAPRGIQLLRNIWRKRQRVDQSVSDSYESHGIVDLCKVAAMIASLADQQQHALPPCWPFGEHFRGVGHRVENGCSVIARLQVLQILFDNLGVFCEV